MAAGEPWHDGDRERRACRHAGAVADGITEIEAECGARCARRCEPYAYTDEACPSVDAESSRGIPASRESTEHGHVELRGASEIPEAKRTLGRDSRGAF